MAESSGALSDGQSATLNNFEFSSTNENGGREYEAPAELFRTAEIASIALDNLVAAQESSAGASHSRQAPQSVAPPPGPGLRAATAPVVSPTALSPAEVPLPAVPPPRSIALQVLHRSLIESVWGESQICNMRQSIQLFGKRRTSFGRYVRAGRGSGRMRLSLQVPAGDQMNSLLQICDGELMTTYESIGDHTMLTQVDLGKVRDRLSISTQVLNDPLIAMYLAIGGQSELLRKICQKYDCTKVVEGTLGQHKVWWIRGQALTQPLHIHARALIDERLFDSQFSSSIPPNVKLAIGHSESEFPFWLFQLETWNDGDEQGRNKVYMMTEWDSPSRLTAANNAPDLFRLSNDPSMREIRDETKLYLPPQSANMASRPSDDNRTAPVER